jgi:hypothetical protein
MHDRAIRVSRSCKSGTGFDKNDLCRYMSASNSNSCVMFTSKPDTVVSHIEIHLKKKNQTHFEHKNSITCIFVIDYLLYPLRKFKRLQFLTESCDQ